VAVPADIVGNPDYPPLVRRLRAIAELGPAEVAALRSLGEPVRLAPARTTLLAQGERAGTAVLLQEGWAIRHRTLADGRRQVLDFVVPGDLCDPSSFVLPRRDYAITAITRVAYALVQPEDVLKLLAGSSRLGALLWWLEAQEEYFARAHLVAVGRLTAYERIAYLIWELWMRLRAVGLATEQSFELPATQDLIADATGLSHVHVSRTLGRMGREGLIQRTDHRYRILQPSRLMALAQVDAGQRRLDPPALVREHLQQERLKRGRPS
jgi:CRP-like cAMP-binding protein